MPGLVPGIHVLFLEACKTWMAGTSPAMTKIWVAVSGLPVRIRVHKTAPAAAVERLPCAFGLRQAIRHRVDHGGMMAHAAMAAFHLDAFGGRGGFLHTALPRADAVGAAEDRGGRCRRGLRQRPAET